ncbi:uncharacterized protein LOC143149628 [Ptiloglossa arizonensis]|uniref:uncharacterized protein LOC143149628 n=1 Tax=Ptiloglossa arizonensis TaxID=3350558 RepID=UPI003FA10DB9
MKVTNEIKGVLGPDLQWLLNLYHKRRFLVICRVARMVLFRKEGRTADSLSVYWPIYLLDDESKIFERVLTARIVEHLTRGGPDLAKCQFRFREGRTTIDAVRRVLSIMNAIVSQSRVEFVGIIECANAFDTLL